MILCLSVLLSFTIISGISSVAAAQVVVPQRVRVSQGVEQGLLKKKVDPVYPPDARDQKIQGVVLLQVIIDKEGNVTDVKLISGHPLLAPAAIDAVKQWKYRPFLLNGDAVSVETQVKVNFTLNP
jgi:protein TonB